MLCHKLASLFACLTLLPLANPAVAQENPGAEEIMHKSFRVTKMNDSKSESTMRLIDAAGKERVRKTITVTRLIEGTTDNMRIVSFIAPGDVKGIKTLLIEHSDGDDDIWLYLPAVRKVRRLIANNKKDSFVGTDFSYGDIVGHKVNAWTHKLNGKEPCGKKSCFVVESTPKDEDVKSASGYSKRITWVQTDNFVTVKGQMFDLDGKLLKEMTSGKITLVDKKNQKWQPMVVEARNVQTGRKTIIEFANFRANVGIPTVMFTPGFIEKQ
jgi:outer membrane lipoprotein-sorting protein